MLARAITLFTILYMTVAEKLASNHNQTVLRV